MFPVFYDCRIVSDAEEWFAQGQPPLAPIYIRNKVAVRWNHYNGSVEFVPVHEEFILVDGAESLLGKFQQGWVNDYPLTVNPATWPDDLGSEDRLRLLVLAAVDPSLLARTAELLARDGEQIRLARAGAAVQKAFIEWHRKFALDEGNAIKPRGPYELGELYIVDGGLLFKQPASPPRIAYYAVKEGRGCVYYAVLNAGRDDVVEMPETFTVTGVELPETAADTYASRLAELRELVARVREEALAQPLEINFPSVEPLERGYPEPQLPAYLKISRWPGTLRTTGAIARWFDAACAMARELGYEAVDSYFSRTGRTGYVEFVLPGRADPNVLCPWVTRVDYERGLLYVTKENIGRVIGKGGCNIRRISRLSGRNWKVLPDSSDSLGN